jgi:hypothetical protein
MTRNYLNEGDIVVLGQEVHQVICLHRSRGSTYPVAFRDGVNMPGKEYEWLHRLPDGKEVPVFWDGQAGRWYWEDGA